CADSADSVHVWDFDAKKELHVLKGGHDLRCLAFSPDGRRLACGGGDRVLHLWDPEHGRPLSRGGDPNLEAVRLAVSPAGSGLATPGGGLPVRVWPTGGPGAGTPALQLDEKALVHALAFSPDGRWLAGGTDAGVRLWDAATGHPSALLDGP